MQQSILILGELINVIDNSANNDEDNQDIEVCDEKYMKSIWSKYESIPNSYHKKTIEYITETGHTKDDIVWCASEKVHGANFSLITNGIDVIAGSRTQILDDTTKFYGGWRDVLNEQKDRVIKAFKILNKKYKNKIKVVIIYGELFGGIYSHPEIKAKKNKKCIQKGVYYTPDVTFYAFDIKTDLDIKQKIETDENKYDDDEEIDGRLTVNEAIEIFEKCGFLYAKILQKGTWNELMKFDVDNLQSTIPKLLGLPSPCDVQSGKEINNVAEGIVIRKLYSKDHCLLKIKSQKFLEIEENARQKGQNKKGKKAKGGNKSNNLEVSFEKTKTNVLQFQNEEFVDFIMRCINDVRFEAVESKMGKLSLDNFKKMQGNMMNDVFKELQNEKSDIMKDIKKKNIGKIRGFIGVAVQMFFKPKIDQLRKETDNQ
eukprot:468650_1